MEPFSVLMSVYAREKASLLDKALSSVLRDQTLLPSEIVLVEDGPLTGELYAVIDSHEKQFPNFVRVRLERNQGLGNALNAGLERCSHEWVARMDSDDISLPGRFERQMVYLASHPWTDVLGTAVNEFESDETVISAVKACPANIGAHIRFRSPVNHPTVMFRRTSVQKAGGYRHCLFMEDYHLWIRMHAAGMTITSLPEPLYLFKMDAGTQRRRGGWKYVKSELVIQKLLLREGIIGIPRYCANVAVRCGGRLIPGGLRAWLYKTLFRSRAKAK